MGAQIIDIDELRRARDLFIAQGDVFNVIINLQEGEGIMAFKQNGELRFMRVQAKSFIPKIGGD